jgi:hypothetical protein
MSCNAEPPDGQTPRHLLADGIAGEARNISLGDGAGILVITSAAIVVVSLRLR